jgi:hypothetical protein
MASSESSYLNAVGYQAGIRRKDAVLAPLLQRGMEESETESAQTKAETVT